MQKTSEGQIPTQSSIASDGDRAGRYVYCIAPASGEVRLEEAGIEGNRVYAFAHLGLCVMVHDCPPKPYTPQDAEATAALVMAHHRVVDAAWQCCGAVIPVTFNTIVGAEEATGQDGLTAWLEREHDALASKLANLAGKAEYGVQVFWDVSLACQEAGQRNPEVAELEKQIRQMPRGLAYMYRQRLDRLLRAEIQARAPQEFEALYGSLRQHVADIRLEKTRNGNSGSAMLMNLSCLVSADRYPELKAELDKVSSRAGFSVRLVGPMPPYSFC